MSILHGEAVIPLSKGHAASPPHAPIVHGVPDQPRCRVSHTPHPNHTKVDRDLRARCQSLTAKPSFLLIHLGGLKSGSYRTTMASRLLSHKGPKLRGSEECNNIWPRSDHHPANDDQKNSVAMKCQAIWLCSASSHQQFGSFYDLKQN